MEQTDKEHCIIIGGGHGGAQLCGSLRQNGYQGEVTLISSDSVLPYHRPPLSKAYLKDSSVETQIIKPQQFYHDNDVSLMLGTTAIGIDPAAQRVELEDGRRLDYSHLVLSTGALARRLGIAGADAGGVHYLKIAEDAAALRRELDQAKKVTVIGGGFIGLEAAATFAVLGKSVTVLEAGDRLLGRAVSPEISDYFLQAHRAAGMEIRLNASVEEISVKDGRVQGVVCDGSTIDTDMVLIGIGVDANCALAQMAGLKCSNGIEIDAHMRTSDPRVLAIGDCVFFEHWQTASRVRLESVQNANDQARNAALTLTGKAEPYHEVAWFWSDQRDDKLQIAGLSQGANRRVVRDERKNSRMAVFHYRDEQLVAVDTVNNPAIHMVARKLLAAGISPSNEQAANTEFNLKTLM